MTKKTKKQDVDVVKEQAQAEADVHTTPKSVNKVEPQPKYNSSFERAAAAVQSKHTSVPVRSLHVKVTIDGLREFNKAFVREGVRKNPLMADKINLTVEELEKFEKFLLKNRVDIVDGKTKIFRLLKRLSMPAFVERVMTDVGRVRILDKGLDIHPVFGYSGKDAKVISLDEAFEISQKIESFEDDLAVVVGAMPGDEEGNPETMTVALIQDYVVGMSDTQDPLVEYIVYALQSILEETQFDTLYYMRYDDVKTIESNMSALGKAMVL